MKIRCYRLYFFWIQIGTGAFNPAEISKYCWNNITNTNVIYICFNSSKDKWNIWWKNRLSFNSKSVKLSRKQNIKRFYHIKFNIKSLAKSFNEKKHKNHGSRKHLPSTTIWNFLCNFSLISLRQYWIEHHF